MPEERQVRKLGEAPWYKSILFYGPPGTGKTWALAKLIAHLGKKAVVIDADDKFEVTIQYHPDKAKLQELVQIWTPPTKLTEGKIGLAKLEKSKETPDAPGGGYIPKDARGFVEIINFFNNDLMPLIEKDSIELIAFDTITPLSDHLYYSILETHKRSAFSLPLWGIYRQNMLQITKGFLSFPVHRVMLAHASIREDEVTKEIHVRPSIQGSYREEMGKEFSEVWYFDGKVGDSYMIRTAGSTKYTARTSLQLKDRVPIDEAISKV